jgi:hypothetical protein
MLIWAVSAEQWAKYSQKTKNAVNVAIVTESAYSNNNNKSL